MSLSRRLVRIATAIAACVSLALVAHSAAAQPAATFLAAIGEVQVLDATGQPRAAARGGALAQGERVVIGASGLAQLRFSDGALLSLRANSDLKIDAYSFRGETDSTASTVLQLLKGGLRAITGAVARLNRSGYRVVTATATIGVRGTDFEVFHIPPPTVGAEAPPGEPGTYLKVNQGIAFIQTPVGALDVLPQQVAFVARATVVPGLLPQVPPFLRSPTPPPTQTPRTEQQPRSDGPARAPGTLVAPTQRLPGDTSRTLTAPTTSPTLDPGALQSPATSPTLTSPTLDPGALQSPATSPTLISPTLTPGATSPTTSPTLSPGITSPTMTSPTLSPGMTAPSTTSPMLSPGMTSPSTTSPTLSPGMTAPGATSPMLSPGMTSPGATSPLLSPGMTAPPPR